MADGFFAPADVSAFRRECLSARSREAIDVIVDREMRRLGLSRYVFGEMANPVAPPRGAVVFNTYPRSWMQRHTEERYLYDDPVLTWLRARKRAVRWDDPEFVAFWSPLHRRIMGEAGEFGVREGFSTALPRIDLLPACYNVSPDDRGLPMDAYKAGANAAVVAIEAAKQLERDSRAEEHRLTDLERSCLQFVSLGKSDWAISEILGVSERSVHHAIERAKRRYGVASRVQAVVRAMIAGEIIAE